MSATYRVTLTFNGGPQSDIVYSMIASDITLPNAVWIGRVFNGWYTAASGGTRLGGYGDLYFPPNGTPNNTGPGGVPIMLYAQWADAYIQYESNGGSAIRSDTEP